MLYYTAAKFILNLKGDKWLEFTVSYTSGYNCFDIYWPIRKKKYNTKMKESSEAKIWKYLTNTR